MNDVIFLLENHIQFLSLNVKYHEESRMKSDSTQVNFQIFQLRSSKYLAIRNSVSKYQREMEEI